MISPPIEVENLTVVRHCIPILYDINFTVNTGELVGIVGPNGAGKTTLIKSIIGMASRVNGSVKIFGLSIKKGIKKISYIPQRGSIDWNFPVTAYDVVMMGRYGHIGLCKQPSVKDHCMVEKCLNKMQMLSYRNKQISELSGGQQQRIFLARALAQESDIYLMDEPFAGVDSITELEIILLLKELKYRGTTILIVHHNLLTAKKYFDNLILLNVRLIAYGKTSDVLNDVLLKETYGNMNNFSI